MNKVFCIFHPSLGLGIVTFKPGKPPAFPAAAALTSARHQSKSIPRPITMGTLEPFVKSGVIRCK